MSTAQIEEKAKRVRKPKARHRDVIIGCMEERLCMNFGEAAEHADRLLDLLAELKRSLGKADDDDV